MKTKYLSWTLLISTLITLFTGCVGEDVVERNSSSLRFERQLRSLASDEQFTLNLEFIDENSLPIEDQSDINIEYSSDNEEVIQINQEGVLTPINNGITTVRVNASIGDFNFREIENEIIVGAVTLSESEALAKDEDEVDDIITNGYDPEVNITNFVTNIGINSSEIIQLNAIYQNLKREVEEVTLTWASSEPSILEIDSNGVITPVSAGTANITASFNSTISEPLSITVDEEDVEVIIIEEPVIEEPEETRNIIGFGSFQSNSSYTVRGNFQIIEEDGVTTIFLDDDYFTGGVPDLVIYLSNVTNTDNGAAFISEDITPLGEQSFIIPESINPNDYTNVLLFCRRFGARVGFGVINR